METQCFLDPQHLDIFVAKTLRTVYGASAQTLLLLLIVDYTGFALIKEHALLVAGFPD